MSDFRQTGQGKDSLAAKWAWTFTAGNTGRVVAFISRENRRMPHSKAESSGLFDLSIPHSWYTSKIRWNWNDTLANIHHENLLREQHWHDQTGTPWKPLVSSNREDQPRNSTFVGRSRYCDY